MKKQSRQELVLCGYSIARYSKKCFSQIYSPLNPTIWHLFPRPSPTSTHSPICSFQGGRGLYSALTFSSNLLSPPKHINGRPTDPITKCPSNQAEPWHEQMVAIETDNSTSYILELRYSPLQGWFLSPKCALVNLNLNQFD